MYIKEVVLSGGSKLNIFIFSKIDKNKLNDTAKSIKQTKNGFAGYAKVEYVTEHIKNSVFSESSLNQIDITDAFTDVVTQISNQIKSLREIYKTKDDLEIYLFPTVSEFTKEKLNGINGYVPYNNVMHLFIHPEVLSDKNFSTNLKNVMAHEYNHLMRYEYFGESETLLEDLVFEGLADNFKINIYNNEPAVWSTIITESEAKKTFIKLKPFLESTNYTFDIFNSVFFEDKEYKLWTGYSIGYYIVRDYLKSLKKIDWKKIMSTSAKEIATSSNWL